MSLVDKALDFATKKHGAQLDDNGKLYIFHPIAVAKILMQITNDENIIAAGYLHDTLEDTDTSYEELIYVFGEDIANLVKEVTKTKSNTFPNLKTQRAILVKFADRLSNLSRMEGWNDKRRKQYIAKSKFWRNE